MQKINFQNLPNTTTPINATNLNAIQTNAENAINGVASDLTTTNGNVSTLNTKVTNQGTYSGNETVIGTWINNKPIYRKVVTFGSSSLNANTNHGISNIEFITNIYGILHHSYGWKPITTFYMDNGQISSFFALSLYDINPTDFNIRAGEWYTNGSVSIFNDSFLVIEYTKTTD